MLAAPRGPYLLMSVYLFPQAASVMRSAIIDAMPRSGLWLTVVQSEIKPRSAEIVLISLNGEVVDYIGISQVGRRVATGQITIAVSNLKEIGLSCRELDAALPSRFSRYFSVPVKGASRPTPRLWEEILKGIRGKLPAAGSAIDGLNRTVAASQVPSGRVEGGLEVFERDAVASALQVFGGSAFRKRVLRRAGAPVRGDTAPFLSRLGEVSIREDPQITHDQAIFPGMGISRRDVIGSVVLTDGIEYLTILNCNRQPLEQTLGVDLIYYSHRFDSFVLVQYKRMSQGKHGSEYRPLNDPSHQKEVERMLKTEEFLNAQPKGENTSTSDFRLSGRPFYVKLCEPKAKATLDAGMVSGMYVPLELWRTLLDAPDARGPKGGVVISWESCWRRFNNGEFTSLLRNGWIGSAGRRVQSSFANRRASVGERAHVGLCGDKRGPRLERPSTRPARTICI
jgi:hypothetical protein